MIPDFIKPFVEKHTFNELTYVCEHVLDWDMVEKNIWIQILEHIAPLLDLEGKNRLYFKLFFQSPNEKNKNKIFYIVEQNTKSKYYGYLVALRDRDLDALNIVLSNDRMKFTYTKFDDFCLKFYHIIFKELINRFPKNQEFSHSIQIKQSVYMAVQCCNQVVKNPWKVDYTFKNVRGKIYYHNPTFYFKNQEDLTLFKLLL